MDIGVLQLSERDKRQSVDIQL
ncbi:hypothetical protein BAE44_0006593 [Dichanthelium oligosanthes]|uniref:Uncharacterized protein n=1 Tax=Dichanthelium oligosanthes TaxID=888268 RepID=A0A1E5W4Y2_9POAL|nr:hypothetical protein BAE44_0006593 [Dichanthelium oligosanthes]